MKLIYSIGVYSYVLAIRLASPFNGKAKKWVDGRKNWKTNLVESLGDKQNIYWFHCASLGEFEQGKPVMEALKENNPSIHLLVTFFSPSGYELRKNYDLADYVCYLPMDSKKNAAYFIENLKIKKAFFVKYEFWFHYFKTLKDHSIPFYMVSAVFRENQVFFKWYGSWYKQILKMPTHIFVQDKASQKLLQENEIQSILSGDTRYDRVYQNSLQAKPVVEIENFKGNDFLVLAGSSWQKEEEILAKAFNNQYKLIIAPHDISESHLKSIENLFPKGIRYSAYKDEGNILIIDNIGMLSNLYQYADLAFIGGGFTGALHNILEPATFGVPVLFGPQHEKFHEANDMLLNGAAYEINSVNHFKGLLEDLILDKELLRSLKQKNKLFVEERRGATDVVLKTIIKA